MHHHGLAQCQRECELGDSGPVERGGRHHHRLPASQRNPVEELGRRERRRVSAGSALRCARGAAGEEDESALRGRRGQRTAVSALHHVVECADLGRRIVLRPGAIGEDLVREGLGDRVELVVVYERLNLLAGGDVDELGPGEPGVHQHQLGAVLGGSEHRQDQAAMIAAHASHDGTGSDAIGLPRPHQGVGLLLDVGVGERAALVDQGHRIQSGLGIRVDGPGERTVLPHGQDRSDALVDAGKGNEACAVHHPHSSHGVRDLGEEVLSWHGEPSGCSDGFPVQRR